MSMFYVNGLRSDWTREGYGERKGACKLKMKCFLYIEQEYRVREGEGGIYIRHYNPLMFFLNHQCTMGVQSTLTFPITHNSLLRIKNFLHRLNKKI